MYSKNVVFSLYVRNEIIIGLTANEWTVFRIFYHYVWYYYGDYDYNFNK